MPDQLQVFDALYTLAARDGRGNALFGDFFAQTHDFYRRMLIGSGYPTAYFEFPLLGEPCLDMLSGHSSVEAGAKFAESAGFGFQKMFDWFSGVCDGSRPLSCGMELDLSAEETEKAAVYLQYRDADELVVPFLESVCESARAPGCLEIIRQMPEGWPPAYVGLFPGREGVPLRIGRYLEPKERARLAEDPSLLGERFRKIGFTAFDEPMLHQCSRLMKMAPLVDFQFDLFPDGSIGDTFGLSLSFGLVDPRAARECMEDGAGAALMQHLQDLGLSDDRWKLLAGAPFARHVPFLREDGSEGRLFLCIRHNFAKVKFRRGDMLGAKFYLLGSAGELNAANS